MFYYNYDRLSRSSSSASQTRHAPIFFLFCLSLEVFFSGTQAQNRFVVRCRDQRALTRFGVGLCLESDGSWAIGDWTVLGRRYPQGDRNERSTAIQASMLMTRLNEPISLTNLLCRFTAIEHTNYLLYLNLLICCHDLTLATSYGPSQTVNS